MPFISPELISEVVERNDIMDYIARSVELKKAGSDFIGLCPFHPEKTPSFSVTPDKQLFYCFGCGAGGTIIEYVMLHESLDFVEAVGHLADIAGVVLPDISDVSGNKIASSDEKIHKKKQRLYSLNADAAKYFFDNLISNKYEEAMRYIKKRGVSLKTIKKFGIGWASSTGMRDFLLKKGYAQDEIFDSGLIICRDDKGVYDKFRNRIMFPIIDLRGRVVGFGGRVIDDSKPKYLNSPETIVFSKSKNLFGLNFAKNTSQPQWIITEGYMDVIQLQQHGIDNVVASLGTAFGSGHAALLKKYTTRVVVCYDGDSAGVKATDRALKILNEAGLHSKVLVLDKNTDPDEYVNLKGGHAFKKLLECAIGDVEYSIRLIKNQYNLDDAAQKIEFIETVAEFLSKIESKVKLEIYIEKFAQEIGISCEALAAEIKKFVYVYKKQKKLPELGISTNCGVKVKKSLESGKAYEAEKLLLNLILDKNIFKTIKKFGVMPSDFKTELHSKIASAIFDLHETNRMPSAIDVINRLGWQQVPLVTEILHDDKNVENKEKAAFELIKIMKEHFIKEKLASLSEKDEDEILKLIKLRKGGAEYARHFEN